MRKMFGIKRRFGSAKEVLKVFRLIHRREDFPASSGVSYPDLERPKTFNVQIHIEGIQRMHEIEAQKAMAISLSRHDKWKAGGPC